MRLADALAGLAAAIATAGGHGGGSGGGSAALAVPSYRQLAAVGREGLAQAVSVVKPAGRLRCPTLPRSHLTAVVRVWAEPLRFH